MLRPITLNLNKSQGFGGTATETICKEETVIQIIIGCNYKAYIRTTGYFDQGYLFIIIHHRDVQRNERCLTLSIFIVNYVFVF